MNSQDVEIVVTRTDGKQTCMDLTAGALSLTLACLEIGAGGISSTGENEEQVWTLLAELNEFRAEPEWSDEDKEETRLNKLAVARALLESAGYMVSQAPIKRPRSMLSGCMETQTH